MMSVEPGRDNDEVWREVHDPWQDRDLHRLPEDFAGIACAKRGIDDLVVLAAFADSPVPGNSGISWVEAYMTFFSYQKICCVPFP